MVRSCPRIPAGPPTAPTGEGGRRDGLALGDQAGRASLPLPSRLLACHALTLAGSRQLSCHSAPPIPPWGHVRVPDGELATAWPPQSCPPASPSCSRWSPPLLPHLPGSEHPAWTGHLFPTAPQIPRPRAPWFLILCPPHRCARNARLGWVPMPLKRPGPCGAWGGLGDRPPVSGQPCGDAEQGPNHSVSGYHHL